MSSILGTVLPRKMVAWFWFVATALPATYFAWKAVIGENSWTLSAIFGGIAALIYLEPRLRKLERETIQVDDDGVLRVDGEIREQVRWNEVSEIRIITTDQGPYHEDVFFALIGANKAGCLVPHDAAVRTKLLQELQVRFPSLDGDMVIMAMGCTSNNNFLLWKRTNESAS